MQRLVGSLGVLLAITAGLFVAGCDVAPALQELADASRAPASAPPSPSAPPATGGETIKIASFNLCVFGKSKLGKPQAMDVLVDVVRRFDVVAVQEIRALDQTVVPQFVQQINADGSRYDFVIGPRLGRTSSKEQYAFLFDTARIELVPNSAYTVPDPHDLMHRAPMVARFRVRSPSSEQPFTFSLVNIHTDPDETDVELNALDDVYLAVQRNPSGEDDVILLGETGTFGYNVNNWDTGEVAAYNWNNYLALYRHGQIVGDGTTVYEGSSGGANYVFMDGHGKHLPGETSGLVLGTNFASPRQDPYADVQRLWHPWVD